MRAIPGTPWTLPGVTHNPKVAGSNPAPATNLKHLLTRGFRFCREPLWRCVVVCGLDVGVCDQIAMRYRR